MQQVWPLAQAGEQVSWQVPATHCWPPVQAWPQAPQLALSVWLLTQVPAHISWPLGQAQAPFTQVWPLGQAWPQLPQLAASIWVLTHVPLQVV
ncbi:MAG TPA: hypothetical protein VHK65_10850 [Candidatus Dormibacteraeota bacterium]|nr:hypothetical protein [Candidatus Dormibacteraeota bacterium]